MAFHAVRNSPAAVDGADEFNAFHVAFCLDADEDKPGGVFGLQFQSHEFDGDLVFRNDHIGIVIDDGFI